MSDEGAAAEADDRRPQVSAWLPLAVLVAVYALVGLSALDHELAQFSGDIGVKLIQIDTLARGHAWLDYPGAEIDPTGQLFPLGPPFIVVHDGRPYSVYLNPVTYLATPAYRWLGIQGGRLLVLLCAAGVVAATVWLARVVGMTRGRATLAAALTLAATPLWLYGWVFWEHAPATLLCVIATAVAIRESPAAFPRRSLIAAAALGVAMACRPEALLYALALAFALAWRARRPAAAGILVVGTPIVYALTSLSLPGMPFIENASLILDKVFGWLSDPTGRPSWLEERQGIVETLLIGVMAPMETAVPTTARRLGLTLAVMLIALGGHRRFGGPSGRLSSGITAVAGLLFVLPALSLAADSQILLSGLLICCPLTIAVMPYLVTGPEGASRDPERGDRSLLPVLGVTALGFLLAAMLLAQNGGGNQWGPRYLLPAMPLIACIVASRPELAPRWGSVPQRLRGWTLIALVIASLAIQLLGMRSHLLSSQRKSEAWERVAALGGDFLLTSAWFIPQEGAGLALREDTPFLLVRSREQMGYALDSLARVATPTFTFLEIAGRSSGARRFGVYMETESTEFYLHPFNIRASRFELSP